MEDCDLGGEYMKQSENENDHFDLDYLDHILAMCTAEKLTGRNLCWLNIKTNCSWSVPNPL